METRQDAGAEDRFAVCRLEEQLYPIVEFIGLGAARAAADHILRTPHDEESVKGWSSCFAALALLDGAPITEALREARRVRAALRKPEPPTAEEVEDGARTLLQAETRALVAEWLAALQGYADSHEGKLSLKALDGAMLPSLPPPVASAFVSSCAARLLGIEGTRQALSLKRMNLGNPEPCIPPEAASFLRQRGVTIVP